MPKLLASAPSSRRLSIGLALLLTASAHAQNAGDSNPPAGLAPAEQVVEMSAFEVTTTQGIGYADANTVSGFKSRQSIMDVPQAELMLTNDFINDVLPTRNEADLLRYVGVNSIYNDDGLGQGTMVRGSRVGTSLTDNLIGPGWLDTYFIDSMEVLKGTVAALYLGTSTTGTLIMTTKKPLPVAQTIVGMTGGSFGLARGTLDSTGPIGTLGDIKLSYRAILTGQSGGTYFSNDSLATYSIHPTVALDYKSTRVVVAYDFDHFLGTYNGNGILNPTGDIWKGVPRQWEGLWPSPIDKIDAWNRGMRAFLDQKFSDSWSMSLYATFWYQDEYGGNAVNTALNWNTNTLSGIFRENDSPANDWNVVDDVTGKTDIGPVRFTTTFGFNHLQATSYSEFWTATRPGIANTYSLPLGPGTVQALEALYVPEKSNGDYPVPANPGSRSLSYSDLIYWMEEVDVIPNWLSLIGNWAFAQTESITDSNISFNTPFTATDVNFHAWLPRIGAILHLTKGISLYVLDSKNFSVQNAVDYNNNRLPNIVITSKEVGVKADLLSGKVVADIATFRTTQTNQGVGSGLINPYGVGYFYNVGTTSNVGWDASLTFSLTSNWQWIATAYNGTVKNQLNEPVGTTYDNSWSVVTRYQFAASTPLKGFAIGAGANVIGGRWLTDSGMTFPAGWQVPPYGVIKVHQAPQAMAFVDYQFSRHWAAHVSGENLLDENYPIGTQSGDTVNPSLPLSVTLTVSYSF